MRPHALRQISGNQNGVNAGKCEGRRGIDSADAGMSVRAPQKACMQRSRRSDIVDVTSASGEERRILEASDSSAEMLDAHYAASLSRITRAAESAA
ncbi:MAG: hypothetical protein NVS2B5_03010 [Beijerinckiaceae bacterium]